MKSSGHITIQVSDDVALRILGTVARRCRAYAELSTNDRLDRDLAGAVAIRVPAPRGARDVATAAAPPRRRSILALLRAEPAPSS